MLSFDVPVPGKAKEDLIVETSKTHDAYAAFRIPAYRPYFTGNLIFILGLQMLNVAVGWEMYERTGSALNLGLVGLVQFIPQLAFVAVAGHFTDIYNRKHVLMAAVSLTSLAAVVLAINAAFGGPLALMYLCLLATGTARAFWMPARSALLPRIVPLSIFENAVSWNSSGFEISSFIGPAIGGFFIYYGGVTAVYVLSAVLIAGFALLLAPISYRHERPAESALTFSSLSAGFRFIWNTKVVLSVMMLDMFGVLLGGATALMPIYAKDILHVGANGLGWLLAAPSAGAVVSALTRAHRGPLQRAGRTILLAVTFFGGATIVFGISRSFPLSLAMLFVLGVCDNISVVVRSTLVQMSTPDDMRGRVSALNGLFIGTSNQLGAFESGAVADLAGPVASVVIGGFGTIAVALITAWLSPSLRKYGRFGGPSG
ncbi:MAG TPA: MFS transporter [Terriglobia bacterium]|nr:MFS transporter [Terriglobia bacterium]